MAKKFKNIIMAMAIVVIAAVTVIWRIAVTEAPAVVEKLTWDVSAVWNDGASVTATLNKGTLTISGTGAMEDYCRYKSPSPWSNVCQSITSVVIEDGVTSIGRGAFYGCTGLTSVTVGSSVTSIPAVSFFGCTGLTNIEVDDGNAVYASVDGVLFYKNKSSLILYPAGRRGAYKIPARVRSIEESAFSGCTGLTSIIIPNSVTSIEESAFSGCAGLTSIIIPNSVTSIGSFAFKDCAGLTSVTIPNSVTLLGGGAFDGCTALTSVTLPDSITTIGWFTFRYCRSLTSVTIPGSVTRIGGLAFQGCSGLNSITVPWPNPPLICSSIFDGIKTTACLYVPEGSVDAYRSIFSWRKFNCIRERSNQNHGLASKTQQHRNAD
ncbi:MAG: leucine-rich repeat domain-containing protein [Chitinispirillales bacterium]|jgi:hypothetical protein|nr:leucine-rich repeat domain-containing protein [Chitinispirillales bacterium]